MTKPSQGQNRHRSPESRSLKPWQFKGIRKRKRGKWVSEIRMPNSTARIWLGSYDTPVKAARAFDFAVYCLRGSKAKLNFPHSPPKIPCAFRLSPPQIQAAAAKFAAEEFRVPLDNGAVSSSSGLEAECGIEGQQVAVDQGPAFRDSVPLERVDNSESLNVEDIPLWDVSMEDSRILFQPMENWGPGIL